MELVEQLHPVVALIESTLSSGGFWYERFLHEPVRTSEEAAQVRESYTLRQGTKALIVKGKKPLEEKRFFMIVVPGDKQFDKKKLRDAAGYTDVRFASPEEVAKITGGVLPGGVPPWGNLFNLQVFADRTILENEKVIFNAGDRRVSIAMLSKDLFFLVKPNVLGLC